MASLTIQEANLTGKIQEMANLRGSIHTYEIIQVGTDGATIDEIIEEQIIKPLEAIIDESGVLG